MDANRQPGIELVRIFVNQVHFNHRLPPTSGDTKPRPTGDLHLEVSVSESADRKAGLILVRLRTDAGNGESPYEFDVEFGGVARAIEGEENLPPSDYLERMGVPMMFPFIREFLANLTMRARNGAVWMRPVNLRALEKLSTPAANPASSHSMPSRVSKRGHRQKEAAMGKKTDRMVFQKDDGQWANKLNAADRASSLHTTQGAAEKSAKAMLKASGGGELTVKGLDGRIRSKDTIAPGNDPNPPRDREH